jgi:hypothetical protein
MLTKAQALEIVGEELRRMSPPGHDIVVVDEDTIERNFGWVFFFNTRKFLETGIFEHRLAGNGPIIVNKHTGEVEFVGTYKSPMHFVEEYERKWAARSDHTPR